MVISITFPYNCPLVCIDNSWRIIVVHCEAKVTAAVLYLVLNLLFYNYCFL